MMNTVLKHLTILSSLFLFFYTIYFNYHFIAEENIIEIFPRHDVIIKNVYNQEKNLEILDIYKIIKPLKEKKLNLTKNETKKEVVRFNEKEYISSKNFKIQIAAVKNQRNAFLFYSNLKTKFPEIFKSKLPYIEKVKIDGKENFFRVKSFENYEKSSAQKKCNEIISVGFECLVVQIK